MIKNATCYLLSLVYHCHMTFTLSVLTQIFVISADKHVRPLPFAFYRPVHTRQDHYEILNNFFTSFDKGEKLWRTLSLIDFVSAPCQAQLFFSRQRILRKCNILLQINLVCRRCLRPFLLFLVTITACLKFYQDEASLMRKLPTVRHVWARGT